MHDAAHPTHHDAGSGGTAPSRPDRQPPSSHSPASRETTPAAAGDRKSPQEIAELAARAMYADDTAAQAVGIEVVQVAPGRARLTMRIRKDMTNGHGIGHGGYTFLLADTAFAYACNSHGQRAVAAGAAIDFVAPTHEGDLLTAEAVEQHLAGRNGLYDIRVTRQDGTLVALFHGRSATIKGRFVD